LLLTDGTEHRAAVVVSNAYGRATVFDMLEGRYAGKALRTMYSSPVDKIGMGIHVSLGVARDLTSEPHAIVLFLDNPVMIADQVRDRLAIESFAFDGSMAPEGKSVLKVLLDTSYTWWKDLHSNRERYDEEKQQVADTVIGLLEARFPGIKEQIEVVDVATPMTTERYTGIAQPFKVGAGQFLAGLVSGKGISMTLPGLDRFYMVGQWAGAPGIPNVSAMARRVVRAIDASCDE
ncbi:MAG: phytoene desaturase family protein, partial [Candidatus Geothermincolia bacterium]